MVRNLRATGHERRETDVRTRFPGWRRCRVAAVGRRPRGGCRARRRSSADRPCPSPTTTPVATATSSRSTASTATTRSTGTGSTPLRLRLHQPRPGGQRTPITTSSNRPSTSSRRDLLDRLFEDVRDPLIYRADVDEVPEDALIEELRARIEEYGVLVEPETFYRLYYYLYRSFQGTAASTR